MLQSDNFLQCILKDREDGGIIHSVACVLRAELPCLLRSRPVVQGKVHFLRRRVGYDELWEKG